MRLRANVYVISTCLRASEYVSVHYIKKLAIVSVHRYLYSFTVLHTVYTFFCNCIVHSHVHVKAL